MASVFVLLITKSDLAKTIKLQKAHLSWFLSREFIELVLKGENVMMYGKKKLFH